MEISGAFNTARVFASRLESSAEKQIRLLCDQEFAKDSRIRIMPDVHAGAGCTIGTTMTIHNTVVPNLVGVDIGCGMETVRIYQDHLEPQKLDKLIYEKIPSGFSIHEQSHRYADQIDLSQLRCASEVNIGRALRSIGTLGGGNHFIEADKDEEGNIYIVIHSGSRHIGLEVAKLYQAEGYRQLNHSDKNAVQELIDKLKAEGKHKEIQKEIKKLKKQIITDVPPSLAFLSGKLLEDYLHDMKIIQQYAVINRKAMMDDILKGMKFGAAERFTTIHNYIDTNSMILRKGAVSAKKGEKLLIPINMRDGSLICIGKGNEDWNFSAPHGAGRLMSRNEAVNSFTVSEFKKQMKGIYSTSISRDTLDECPMAYKDMKDIVDNIGPTADIVSIIRPIYNFKAGGSD